MQTFDRTANPTKGEFAITDPEELELPYGLNKEDFWAEMDDWEATDKEKLAWLTELAHIVKGFVDWGLGQDTVQMMMAKNFVDNQGNDNAPLALDSGNVLEHKDSSTDKKVVSSATGEEGQNE